jgi:hypothetical protein
VREEIPLMLLLSPTCVLPIVAHLDPPGSSDEEPDQPRFRIGPAPLNLALCNTQSVIILRDGR